MGVKAQEIQSRKRMNECALGETDWQFISYPKCGCSTVSDETVCAFKEQWSVANADYPIGARVALKCTV